MRDLQFHYRDQLQFIPLVNVLLVFEVYYYLKINIHRNLHSFLSNVRTFLKINPKIILEFNSRHHRQKFLNHE